MNFIFGGNLPSDPGRKPFALGKNPSGVRVGGCGCGGSVCLGGGGESNFGLSIRDRRNIFGSGDIS